MMTQLNVRKRSHSDSVGNKPKSKKHKPLLVPVGVWKTFPRLKLALEFATTCLQDVAVFAYENRSLLSKPGIRRFLVTTYYEFGQQYISMKSPKHFYEVITEGSVCHLYFDLEYNILLNPTVGSLHVLEIFKQYVSCQLKFLFNVSCGLGNILDLESTSAEKFSRHLIYHLDNSVFRNNLVVGNFVKYICDRLRILKDSGQDNNYKDIIHINNGGLYTCCCPPGDELLKLFIATKNGVGLICDEGVYTRNRNFRLLLSTKKNKKVKLKVAKESCFKSVHGIDPNKRKWSTLFNNLMDSLICNVRYETTSTILDTPFTNSSKTSNIKTTKHQASIALATAPILTTVPVATIISLETKTGTCIDGASSQYPLIDQFITKQLAKDGKIGKIREWTYFSQGKLIVYEISDYRWCENIRRHHKSNNIMIIADLKDASYYQKCHDPECRRIDYRSPKYPIPTEIIPLHDEEERETELSKMRRSLVIDYNENDSFSDDYESLSQQEQQQQDDTIISNMSLEEILEGAESEQEEIDLEISRDIISNLSYEDIFSNESVQNDDSESWIGELSVEELFGETDEVTIKPDHSTLSCNAVTLTIVKHETNIEENHELTDELLHDLSYEDVFNSPLSIHGGSPLPRDNTVNDGGNMLEDDSTHCTFTSTPIRRKPITRLNRSCDHHVIEHNDSCQSSFTGTPIKQEPIERDMSCDHHVTEQNYSCFTGTPIKQEPIERDMSCDHHVTEQNDSCQPSFTGTPIKQEPITRLNGSCDHHVTEQNDSCQPSFTGTPIKQEPIERDMSCDHHVTCNDEHLLSQEEMKSFLEMDNDQ